MSPRKPCLALHWQNHHECMLCFTDSDLFLLSSPLSLGGRILPLHSVRHEKRAQPKLLSPDISQWGRGLPREGVGAKEFGIAPRNQGNQAFFGRYPGFCRDIPELPGKLEKKKFVFNFCPLFRNRKGALLD